jgi:hypothetical protein
MEKTAMGVVWGSPRCFKVTLRDAPYPRGVYEILNPTDTKLGAPVVVRYNPRRRRRVCEVISVQCIHHALGLLADLSA